MCITVDPEIQEEIKMYPHIPVCFSFEESVVFVNIDEDTEDRIWLVEYEILKKLTQISSLKNPAF